MFSKGQKMLFLIFRRKQESIIFKNIKKSWTPVSTGVTTFYEIIKFNLRYHFRILKKWGDRLCWGPGARPERAGSIGWVAPCPGGSKLVSSGGGGGYLPRPIHGEISAL